ncbi:hypothetical protein [Streptococcus cristatus]|nr:hypothetical protein [Streptococcus cristatus]
MKAIGRVILLLLLIPLVFPIGFIAIMLDPFLVLLEEENNGNDK